jgi:two-component system phosphate regulon response regulator OmpR
VLSRAQIAELVDLGLDDALDRAVDVQISRIRALIEADPRQPRHLLTVRGVGYRFSPADGEG